MKFATPEVESQYTAWRSSYNETRRRLKLARELADYKSEHCRHGWSCEKCTVDFMVDHAPTMLARIDQEMATEAGAFVCQLTQNWRLLVGPAAAQAVADGPVFSHGSTATGLLPRPVAEEPAMDFMVVGGTGPTYDATAITLAPVDPRGGGRYQPRFTVSVKYLIENGVMLSL
jgi:hypothetical protein